MSRVLVTGASGFIGQWAVRTLAEAGHEVHGVVRSPAARPAVDVAFHQADALDSDRIEALIDDLRPSHLLLSAWITTPGAYWNDPANERWVAASTAAARAFWRHGGQHIVLVGTCAEYDWQDPILRTGPVRETDAQGEPHTVYGRAKRHTAATLAALSREFGASFVNARIFFPVGPGESKDKFLPTIIRSLLAGKPCALGPCDYVRDFIDVRDVGAALAALVENAVTGRVNVGSGKGSLLSDVANMAGAMLGRPDLIHIGALAPRQDDPPVLVGDISRLTAETGFRPTRSIERTISDAIVYWRDFEPRNGSAMITIVDEDSEEVIVRNGGQETRYPLASNEGFAAASRAWVRAGWDVKYSYSFTWFGRPIIQLPEDLVRIQEVIYGIRPDVIVETGVAHGGSLVFYATLLKAMGRGRVVGVDINIRPQNRKAIESHELSSLITLIEGDALALSTRDRVKAAVGAAERVIVILDSNHTKEHVLSELRAYAPLVSVGSYIVATDGVMEDLAGAPRSQSDWSWNNPKQAAIAFAMENGDFSHEEPKFLFNEGQVTGRVTHWPGAFLKRIR